MLHCIGMSLHSFLNGDDSRHVGVTLMLIQVTRIVSTWKGGTVQNVMMLQLAFCATLQVRVPPNQARAHM